MAGLKSDIVRRVRVDPTAWALIGSNLLTAVIAFLEGWSLLSVLWVYWFQNIIIGFSNFIRILSLRDFSTEGVKINDKEVKPTVGTKIMFAIFFAFHYGFFHVVYAAFLLTGSGFLGSGNGEDFFPFLFAVGLFFFNHLFSLAYNLREDMKRKQYIGVIMIMPYARIIPMHFTIIFGVWVLVFFGIISSTLGLPDTGSAALLVFFMLLKTVADVIMHDIEHTDPEKILKLMKKKTIT
ncbi:MAG: hypothetical protein JW778_07700 [Candidatus Altiarchaeota archaeon]|nr:hypothetical protein [Candidatus Altiarchaeota archaeon]